MIVQTNLQVIKSLIFKFYINVYMKLTSRHRISSNPWKTAPKVPQSNV